MKSFYIYFIYTFENKYYQTYFLVIHVKLAAISNRIPPPSQCNKNSSKHKQSYNPNAPIDLFCKT